MRVRTGRFERLRLRGKTWDSERVELGVADREVKVKLIRFGGHPRSGETGVER
jgi:hypothetical protein